MNKILISYDLVAPGRDYNKLISAISALGDWAKPLESTWIVATSKTPVQVRDHLVQFLDANDKILVISIGKAAAWRNLGPNVSEWLKTNLK